MSADSTRVFRLEGKLQHYDWGGIRFLPELLGISNPEQRPFAEYWLGAHDQSSAEILLNDGKKTRLDDYIRLAPAERLGPAVYQQFGRLPYLLKLLDVRKMLSIQVHPSKKDAEKEFEREKRVGLPVDAPERNYKDDNHKPELMLALGDFWLLHGFKPRSAMRKKLSATKELNSLQAVFESGSYEALYRTVMEMNQSAVDQILNPLLDRIIPAYQRDELRKEEEDFWAARAALTFSQEAGADRGIFSIYFFNLLQLRKGEAIFQDAGLPHAYLEGQNVEIMANSDNVLRAGLTRKHIDVNELMKHVKFQATDPEIITGQKSFEQTISFPTPAADFELSAIQLAKGSTMRLISSSVEIFMVMEGIVSVSVEKNTLFERKKGDSWVSFDQADFQLEALEKTIVYKAAVPVRLM